MCIVDLSGILEGRPRYFCSPVHIELKSAKLLVMFRQFCGYASDRLVYERVSQNILIFASSFFAAILRIGPLGKIAQYCG